MEDALIFAANLQVVQRKSCHYENSGQLDSTDMDCGRRRKAPERFIEMSSQRTSFGYSEDDDSSEPPRTPVQLPCLPHKPVTNDPDILSIQSPDENRMLMQTSQRSNRCEHPSANFVSSSKRIDELVSRKGLTPGTEAATYFLVSQMFRRQVILENEVKELRLQMPVSGVLSQIQTNSNFSVPVVRSDEELNDLLQKLEDDKFRSELVRAVLLAALSDS